MINLEKLELQVKEAILSDESRILSIFENKLKNIEILKARLKTYKSRVSEGKEFEKACNLIESLLSYEFNDTKADMIKRYAEDENFMTSSLYMEIPLKEFDEYKGSIYEDFTAVCLFKSDIISLKNNPNYANQKLSDTIEVSSDTDLYFDKAHELSKEELAKTAREDIEISHMLLADLSNPQANIHIKGALAEEFVIPVECVNFDENGLVLAQNAFNTYKAKQTDKLALVNAEQTLSWYANKVSARVDN